METPAQVKRIQALQRTPDSRKRDRRFLWLLLLLIPICLWLTSQIALWGLGANQVQDTVLSNMIADYGQWQPQRFSPLKPELIGTIRADQATLIALPGIGILGTIVPFIPLGTGTQIAEVPSATPTSTSTRAPTATPTSTSTLTFPSWPTRTPTPTETNTPLPGPTSVAPTAAPPTIPSPLPTIQFSRVAYSVNENAGYVTITVTLNAPSLQMIAVTYATSDGTATAPADYGSTTNVLSIPPNQLIQMFDIPISVDMLSEGDETFQVALTNPINATLGTSNPATVTVLDDDPPPCSGVSGTYTLGDPALTAVDDGSLDVACNQAVIVDLGSTPITANIDAAFDLAIYERRDGVTGNIEMDWVIVQVGTSSTGPWLTVFYWGDGGPDLNTSLGRSSYTVTEADNEPIPMANAQLLTAPMAPFLITGIGIDVDAFVFPGDYQWLRVFAPPGGTNDPSQVDYIEIFTP